LAVGAVPQPEGVAGDLPLKLLRSIARAKAHDRHEPKLAFRVLKKRRLRISATDDRRVEALEITVDKRRILVRAPAKRAKVRKLTKTLKLKKGRHAVRAVAYDTAYGSTEKQRRVRIRGR
jgi:hypothetical protein